MVKKDKATLNVEKMDEQNESLNKETENIRRYQEKL